MYIEEIPFLSSSYNHSEIYVRATDVNRTLQSAYSLLMGLYPDSTGPNLPPGLDDSYKLPPFLGIKQPQGLGEAALPLNHQNIPVHTVPDDDDPLLNPYPLCDYVNTLEANYKKAHL
jgi:hypothetical protein